LHRKREQIERKKLSKVLIKAMNLSKLERKIKKRKHSFVIFRCELDMGVELKQAINH
jgi:hypothetical protein